MLFDIYRNRAGPFSAFVTRALRTLFLRIVTLPTDIGDLLWVWQRRQAERDSLLGLDDRLLKDVGLTRADADQEGRKPLWRE